MRNTLAPALFFVSTERQESEREAFLASSLSDFFFLLLSIQQHDRASIMEPLLGIDFDGAPPHRCVSSWKKKERKKEGRKEA